MPTHEEQLETVEYDLKQFQMETIKAYTDVIMELAMLKELTEEVLNKSKGLQDKKETDNDALPYGASYGGRDRHCYLLV